MRIDIITLFPEMFEPVLNGSIIGRAQKSGVLEIVCHQLRDYAFDKHKRVDDTPYGGGMGMLMKAEPIALCFEDICKQIGKRPHFVYMSPQGKTLNEQAVQQFVDYDGLIVLCGRYEGVDERLIQHYVDQEWSIGDYVLSGGELPAMVLLDSIIRRLPNVMSDEQSAIQDSFVDGLLDCPQYTKPDHFEGLDVPEVLKSGHHANIEKWRFLQRYQRTLDRRPELVDKVELTKQQKKWLKNSQD